MSDDINILEWAFKGLVSIILAIGAGAWGWVMNKLGKQDEAITKQIASHTDHVLYAERTFSKADHVEDSFNRVYNTLNKMSDNIQNMGMVQATLASNVANMATNFQNMTNKMVNKG